LAQGVPIELLSNKVEAEIGVAFCIAGYSVLRKAASNRGGWFWATSAFKAISSSRCVRW
jgi:hypothetical protein